MGPRPTQEDENRVEEGIGRQLHLTLSSRPERSAVEKSAVSHIWRKEPARYGAPSIGGHFGSILQADLGAPFLRNRGPRQAKLVGVGSKGGKPQPLAEHASQDDSDRMFSEKG